jgi:hypothetical protein
MFDLELSMAGACSNAATLSVKRRSVLRTAGVYDIGLRARLAPRLSTRAHNFRIAAPSALSASLRAAIVVWSLAS